jgi:hypothetical protein
LKFVKKRTRVPLEPRSADHLQHNNQISGCPYREFFLLFLIITGILGREHVKLKLTSQDPDTLIFIADHSTRNNSEKLGKVSDTCLFLDLTGIAASMAASYIAGIHYAFFCYPWWRNFYLITVGIQIYFV